MHAELVIEVFRHKLLHSQVLDKPRKAVQDCHMLTRAHLIDNKDIVRLRKEKEAKKSKSKRSKKGKKASPSPSMDSTEQEEWDEYAEEEENDDEIVVSESESGGDSELEDVIVVRRGR